MKLRQALRKVDHSLYSRMQVAEAKARELMEYAQGGTHLAFTTHGLSHISAVENNYNWLLSDEDIDALNSLEIFCLLLATFFHDSQMIPRAAGEEEAARAGHAYLAKDFLVKNRDLLGISVHEAMAISEIIRAHAVDAISEIEENRVLGSELVNLRKLGACLSMADICHADSSRAPDIVFRHLELNEESAYHWRRHLQISGITRQGRTLIMDGVYFSAQGETALNDYREELEKQLEIVHPYFRSSMSPIESVELRAERLDSQLDVPMRFQANVPAILNILIEGVYDRYDVFIRELVQNSLDACHVQLATAMRRSESYKPKILVTELALRGEVVGLRVDDNGCGMDINDIQDTVLWIGNTVSERKEVKALLAETTQKKLIATFGIGLLACFKVSKRIVIRSAKEGREAFEISISSIDQEIKPTQLEGDSVGTTILLEFDESFKGMKIGDSIRYYCRMVDQVLLRRMGLDWTENSKGMRRDRIFAISETEADDVSAGALPQPDKETAFFRQIKGRNFVAWFWFRCSSSRVLERDRIVSREEGVVTLLNEGVLIGKFESQQWLPMHLRNCSGLINFAAGAVDLPVARDSVIENHKKQERLKELSENSILVIEKLVETTGSKDSANADLAGITLAYIYGLAEDYWKRKIINRLGLLKTRTSARDRERGQTLDDIVEGGPGAVYLEYEGGRYVDYLDELDGKSIYHKPDDLILLQAALLRQNGEVVICANRLDVDSEKVNEAEMISKFFLDKDVAVVDLTKETVVGDYVTFRPVPVALQEGDVEFVRFVKVTGLPDKRGWRVGKECWVNLANDEMNRLYSISSRRYFGGADAEFVKIFIFILSGRFQAAADRVLDIIFPSRKNAD